MPAPRSYTGGIRRGVRQRRDARSDKFNVPICRVQELLPGGISLFGKVDVHARIAARLYRFADKAQMGLCRRASAFSDVASDACADDVLPAGGPVLGPGYDVVKAQFRGRKLLSAVLAGVAVARENVAAIELHLSFGKPGKGQNPNDAGNKQRETNGSDPIVLVRLELLLESAELGPILEVVGDIAAVLDTDHLGDRLPIRVALEEKRKGAAHADHAQGGIVGVEQQNAAVQVRFRTGNRNRWENVTSSQ